MKKDLSPLLGKQDNTDDESGKVHANEWNTLVEAVQENQGSVMSIMYNGRSFKPDENGQVKIIDTGSNYLFQIPTTALNAQIPYKVALGNKFELETVVTNKYIEGDEETPVSTSCRLQYVVNGITVKEIDGYDGQTYVENIGVYLTEGKNVVQILGDNGYTVAESKPFEITAIYLSVNLPTFDSLKPVTGDKWELAVQIVGSNANVYIKVDGEGGLVGNQTAGSTTPYTIVTGLTHGVHTLEVYAISEEDATIKTDSIIKEYFYIVDGNSTTLIGTSFVSGTEIDMYNVLQVPYWVYSYGYTGIKEATVQILGDLDEVLFETIQNITLTNGISELQTFQRPLYDENLVGDRKIRISIDSAQRDVRVLIMANDTILQEVSGYDLVLSSAGRSNKDINYNDWSYGPYKVTFPEDFEFSSFGSGWNKDSDGNVAMHVRRGKFISLNYLPFSVNPAFGNDSDVIGTKTGLTISLEFATRNCVLRDAEVIRCVYNGVGFVIKANSLTFASNSESLSADFKEDTHIRVDLVIEGNLTRYVYEDGGETKTSDEARMLVYVDGVYQQMKLITSSTSFKQVVAQEIIIGSDYCDIDVYCIRAYRTALNMKAITDNYAFDTPNVDEKIKIAARNDIFDSNLNVSYAKLVTARPNLPIMLLGMEKLPDSKTKIPIASTVFTNPNNTDNYDAGAASFTSSDDEIGNQGTSSLNYPMPYRNFDEKFSGEKIMVNGVKYSKYITYPGMPPAKSFTYKKDYASSEMCNNVIMSMIYTEMGYALKDTFPNVLTLAQKNLGLQYRQTLFGFPFFIFKYWNEQYTPMGMFNFINYKNDEKYLGFTGNYTWEKSRAQCWEIRDNNVFWETAYEAPYWDPEANEGAGGEKNDIFRFYEGRYPKDSTYNENNDFGHAAVEGEIEGAIDETKDLLRLHNWLVSTNQANATGALLATKYTDKYGIVHSYDNAAYRRAKFITEQPDYLIIEQWVLYYIWREQFWMYDSGSKNLDLYTMDGIHWGCMVRDADTAMGIDNEGRFVFPPYLEDKDYIVGDKFVYDKTAMPEGGRGVLNGQHGTIWINVRDCFGDMIQQMYVALYSNSSISKFSYAQVTKMCEDHQSQWSESLYNFGQKQYSGGAIYSKWITSGLGDKKNQRKFWLYYGFRYRMSKYHAGSTINRITWRVKGNGSNLVIKPYTQLYVSLGFGTYEYNTTKRYRCTDLEQGVTVVNEFTNEQNDTVMYLFNGDLIVDLGNLYEFGDTGSYQLENASRLRYLRLGNHNNIDGYVNTKTQELDLRNVIALEYLDLSNCRGFGSQTGQNGIYTLDLSNQTSLKEFYCNKSTITNITFPETETLHTIHLNDKLKKLRLVNLPGLTNFSMAGGNNLESIVIKNTGTVNTYNTVFEAWATGEKQLTDVDIENVNWTRCSAEFIDYLASINAKLTGKIEIASGEIITFEMKKRWISIWGNIDFTDNDLYIKHDYINVSKISISGEIDLSSLGTYKMDLISDPINANNIVDITWELTNNNYAYINEKTGVITVHTLPASGLTPTATVSAKLTKNTGSVLTTDMTVYFYKPKAHKGDYLFHDGSYSSYINASKTIVGIIVEVDESGYHGRAVTLNVINGGKFANVNFDFRPLDTELILPNSIDGSQNMLPRITWAQFVDDYFDVYGNIKITAGAGATHYEWTDNYINVAKKRVTDKGRVYPTTLQEYKDYEITYPDDYADCCPVALLSTFYEPTIKENQILADNLKAGNWRLGDYRDYLNIYYLVATKHECYKNKILLVPNNQWADCICPMGSYDYGQFRFWGFQISTSSEAIFNGLEQNITPNTRTYPVYYVVNF